MDEAIDSDTMTRYRLFTTAIKRTITLYNFINVQILLWVFIQMDYHPKTKTMFNCLYQCFTAVMKYIF